MTDRLQLQRFSYYLLPLSLAALLFGLCLYVMASRLFYPYELEWIEGGMLQSVIRIMDGLPLYAKPDMDYVPPLYAPLYFHVAAWSAHLFGAGLPALRIVSVLAACLSAMLVALSVWQLSRSRLASLLALFCWGSLYRFSGNWYDVGRVDSLWGFFLLSAVTALIFFRQRGGQQFLWLALPCLVLAVFTKQTSLMLLPFFMLVIWCWAGFFQAVRFGVVLAAVLLLACGILQWQSDGVFYFYTMQMANGHKFNHGIPYNFLHGDLVLGVPVYLALACGFVISHRRSGRDVIAWGVLLSGFLLMSLLSRWYSGGYINVLIPLHQLLLVMGISAFAAILTHSGTWKQHVVKLIAVVMLSLNIALGWFSPDRQIPDAADKACGDKLVARMAQVSGKVCVFKHNELSWLAGKPFCAHEAFAADVFNGSNKNISETLATDIRQKLLGGYYQVLLLDSQIQFGTYGIGFGDLPYTVTEVDCPHDSFYPRVQGQRAVLWLEYNGTGFRDARIPETGATAVSR